MVHLLTPRTTVLILAYSAAEYHVFPNERQRLRSRHFAFTTAQEFASTNFNAKETLLQRWQQEATLEWLQILDVKLAMMGQ